MNFVYYARIPYRRVVRLRDFPVVMFQVSLLLNLFIEMGVVPPENMDEQHHHFPLTAAKAILTTLQTINPDLGAQLAVRFLLPFAFTTTSNAVADRVANMLEQYAPSSVEDGQSMLSIVEPDVIHHKNAQILNGCTSIILQLYENQMKINDITRATMILLDGIKLERWACAV